MKKIHFRSMIRIFLNNVYRFRSISSFKFYFFEKCGHYVQSISYIKKNTYSTIKYIFNIKLIKDPLGLYKLMKILDIDKS